MPTTAWTEPTLVVNDITIGTVAWADEANAQIVDGSGATADLGGDQESNYLLATTFGFVIPGTATINGIEVEITRKSDTDNDTLDLSVVLAQGSLPGAIGSDKASATFWIRGVYNAATYGGAADAWGATLTGADVNDSGFGCAIAAQHTAGSLADVDGIRMRITYTVAGVATKMALTGAGG